MVLNSTQQPKLDILLWAHSDQMGGTELPCILAEALLRHSPRRDVAIGIATPYPRFVDTFFPSLSGKAEVLASREMLALAKHSDGSVDGDRTAALVAERFRNLEFTLGGAGRDVENRLDQHTVIISCGEPVALHVANKIGCRGIIVTDHLLTVSVRHVLEDAGLLDHPMADLMTEFEKWDRSATAAYLTPIEFASPEYTSYLSLGGFSATPTSGLFYEPLSSEEAHNAAPYRQVAKAADGAKLACVFGGGGEVWDSIAVDIDRRARLGENNAFAVINRYIEDNKPVRGRWLLHKPGGQGCEAIEDPGRMMYWYAACDLVVSRGGLVAQQVAASMLSELEKAPELLFIEEPGHPQIESERRDLYRLGLVHTRKLRGFQQDPFQAIQAALDAHDSRRRLLARARYSRDALQTLAGVIWDAHVDSL